jgi:hypothetical protein
VRAAPSSRLFGAILAHVGHPLVCRAGRTLSTTGTSSHAPQPRDPRDPGSARLISTGKRDRTRDSQPELPNQSMADDSFSLASSQPKGAFRVDLEMGKPTIWSCALSWREPAPGCTGRVRPIVRRERASRGCQKGLDPAQGRLREAAGNIVADGKGSPQGPIDSPDTVGFAREENVS